MFTATPESLHRLEYGSVSSKHCIRDRTNILRLSLVHKFSLRCTHGKCPAAKNARLLVHMAYTVSLSI